MSVMHLFPIGGMKKQHDAILESFGTTEAIIYSLTRLTSTTGSLLFSLTLKTLKFPLLLPFLIFEIILSQILTERQNAHQRKFSKSKYDLAANPQ